MYIVVNQKRFCVESYLACNRNGSTFMDFNLDSIFFVRGVLIFFLII